MSIGPPRWRRIATAYALGGLGLVWLGGGASASAYSTPALYRSDPWRTGGAGGRSFTGSPADGYTCGVCHRGETVERELRGGPLGGYELGATYDFEIAWPGERAGMTVEATDLEGRSLGSLVSPPLNLLEGPDRCTSGGPGAEAIGLDDGRRVLGVSECGSTRLRLQWTAPAEPAEGSIFLSMVIADGDGSPHGDATAVVEVPLSPRGGEAGCSVAGASDLPWWPGTCALIVLLGCAGRRRGAVLLVVGTGALGCARVQPYERGRLAQPDMQVAEEGDLEGGPEHALDYREGSAGGVGGNGGGCGCN